MAFSLAWDINKDGAISREEFLCKGGMRDLLLLAVDDALNASAPSSPSQPSLPEPTPPLREEPVPKPQEHPAYARETRPGASPGGAPPSQGVSAHSVPKAEVLTGWRPLDVKH